MKWIHWSTSACIFFPFYVVSEGTLRADWVDILWEAVFFPREESKDVCVPDRSVHFYQLTVIISDFPRCPTLQVCLSVSVRQPHVFCPICFSYAHYYIYYVILSFISREVCSHVIPVCIRTEESNKEGSGSTKEGERCRHKVRAVVWSSICYFENVSLFIDKLLQLLHKIYIFIAFSLMRGVLFSIVMPMPHVTRGNLLFVFALFLWQRLTIQRRRWKRKEGKRTYSFRFSSKSNDTLLNIVSVFCFWLWFMCVTFFMLKFNQEADNINTALQSDSQIHSKQQ